MLSHLALSLLTKIPSRRECAKGFGELGMRTVSFSDFSAANAPNEDCENTYTRKSAAVRCEQAHSGDPKHVPRE